MISLRYIPWFLFKYRYILRFDLELPHKPKTYIQPHAQQLIGFSLHQMLLVFFQSPLAIVIKEPNFNFIFSQHFFPKWIWLAQVAQLCRVHLLTFVTRSQVRFPSDHSSMLTLFVQETLAPPVLKFIGLPDFVLTPKAPLNWQVILKILGLAHKA